MPLSISGSPKRLNPAQKLVSGQNTTQGQPYLRLAATFLRAAIKPPKISRSVLRNQPMKFSAQRRFAGVQPSPSGVHRFRILKRTIADVAICPPVEFALNPRPFALDATAFAAFPVPR